MSDDTPNLQTLLSYRGPAEVSNVTLIGAESELRDVRDADPEAYKTLRQSVHRWQTLQHSLLARVAPQNEDDLEGQMLDSIVRAYFTGVSWTVKLFDMIEDQ